MYCATFEFWPMAKLVLKRQGPSRSRPMGLLFFFFFVFFCEGGACALMLLHCGLSALKVVTVVDQWRKSCAYCGTLAGITMTIGHMVG